MPEIQRILVVDDDPVIQGLLARALGKAGYEVDVAPRPDRALEMLERQTYDAAVIDFDLPGMNGAALHRRIRGVDPRLALQSILISGGQEANEYSDYFASHGGGFLPKPFAVPTLVGLIRGLLRKAS